MTLARINLTYRVRVATRGASVVSGFVDFSLSVSDLAAPPSISGQAVDVIEGHTESRSTSLTIVDYEGVITSRLGDVDGAMQLLGRLVEIQESDNNGFSWTTIATGRWSDLQETTPGEWNIQIDDERWLERNTTLFDTAHTSYIWPSGLKSKWRGFEAGVPSSNAYFLTYSAIKIFAGVTFYEIRAKLKGYPISSSVSSWVSQDLRDFPLLGATIGVFRTLVANINGIDYKIAKFGAWDEAGLMDGFSPNNKSSVLQFWISIPTGETVPPLFSYVPIYLHAPTAEPSQILPFHLGMQGDAFGTDTGQIHPFEFAKRTYDLIGVRYSSAAFAALIADANYGQIGIRVESKAVTYDFLEANIYKTYGVVPFINANGEVAPKSIRLPADIDIDTLPEINNSNLAGGGHPTFEHTSQDVINRIRFNFTQLKSIRQRAGAIDGWYIQAGDDWWADGLLGRQDYREAAPEDSGVSSNVFGIRRTEFELHGINAGAWSDFVEYLKDNIKDLGGTVESLIAIIKTEVFYRFKDGAIRGQFTGIRSTDSIQPGDLVLLSGTTLPNPAVNARGAGRIVQIVSKKREITGPIFEFLDVGPFLQPIDPPTLSLDLEAPDILTYTLGDVVVGGAAIVQIGYGVTQPTVWQRAETHVADGDYVVEGHPSSTTIWVRARNTSPGRISSIWVYETVTTGIIPRILSVLLELNTENVPLVSWIPGAETAGVRVYYKKYLFVDGVTTAIEFTDYLDFDAAVGFAMLLLEVLPGEVVSVLVEPWSEWTGSAVAGVSGEAMQATARNATPFESDLLAFRVISETNTQIVLGWTPTPNITEEWYAERTVPSMLADPWVGVAESVAPIFSPDHQVTVSKPPRDYITLVRVEGRAYNPQTMEFDTLAAWQREVHPPKYEPRIIDIIVVGNKVKVIADPFGTASLKLERADGGPAWSQSVDGSTATFDVPRPDGETWGLRAYAYIEPVVEVDVNTLFDSQNLLLGEFVPGADGEPVWVQVNGFAPDLDETEIGLELQASTDPGGGYYAKVYARRVLEGEDVFEDVTADMTVEPLALPVLTSELLTYDTLMRRVSPGGPSTFSFTIQVRAFMYNPSDVIIDMIERNITYYTDGEP